MDINGILDEVREASGQLALLDKEVVDGALYALADALTADMEGILKANEEDLRKMSPENPKYDRLKLTPERLEGIARGIREVAAMASPLGRVLEERTLPNGLHLRKVSVPFGVIGVIYEARPNVSLDVFALCFKSGNACVLKGGSDADASNRAIVALIHRVLEARGIPSKVVELLPPGREAAAALLHAEGRVDLIIPRGSSALIEYVRKEATVPVIETGAGICHTYFDEVGDREKGQRIICNAKTRRVSVCNALDCLLVHAGRLEDLPFLCAPLQKSRVVIYADERAYKALEGHYPAEWLVPADARSFGTEFLDYKMAIRTTDTVEEALRHIAAFGSKHSECIVTEDKEVAAYFCRRVDAACVYVNAPTSFTDGGEFGLGAEIGISTQKLHARGPMGLNEITTYKWWIEGNGQIRE